jgi:hypothetical protein
MKPERPSVRELKGVEKEFEERQQQSTPKQELKKPTIEPITDDAAVAATGGLVGEVDQPRRAKGPLTPGHPQEPRPIEPMPGIRPPGDFKGPDDIAVPPSGGVQAQDVRFMQPGSIWPWRYGMESEDQPDIHDLKRTEKEFEEKQQKATPEKELIPPLFSPKEDKTSLAEGGVVEGYGSAKSDSNLRASNGRHVVTADGSNLGDTIAHFSKPTVNPRTDDAAVAATGGLVGDLMTKLARGFAGGGLVGGITSHVANIPAYAGGGAVTTAATESGGSGIPSGFHQLDLRTDKGNFSAAVSEDTMEGIRQSSLGGKLSSTGTRPTWYS